MGGQLPVPRLYLIRASSEWDRDVWLCSIDRHLCIKDVLYFRNTMKCVYIKSIYIFWFVLVWLHVICTFSHWLWPKSFFFFIAFSSFFFFAILKRGIHFQLKLKHSNGFFPWHMLQIIWKKMSFSLLLYFEIFCLIWNFVLALYVPLYMVFIRLALLQ